MKKGWLVKTVQAALVLALIGSLLGAGGSAQAIKTIAGEQALTPWVDFVPGQVLVKFREGNTPEAVQSLALDSGAQRVETLAYSGVEVWQAAEGSEIKLVERLNSLPQVEYAGLNFIYRIQAVPNDPDYPKQWSHQLANAPIGWDISTGSAAVTIAIIDTGIDKNHPDLKNKIVPGWDFDKGDSDPDDKNGHGTHVAGIAAGSTNNATGIAGVSWGAKVMPVRTMNGEGSGATSKITQGINWAVAHDAQVINLSLGSTNKDLVMDEAIAKALAAGVVVVAAAGNNNNETPFYPAAYDGVLAVGATGRSGSRAPYSNYGSYIDLVAPGGEKYKDPAGIYSTLPTYDVYLNTHEPFVAYEYDYMPGTSMASPYVAGAAALVLSLNPGLSPDQVSQIITSTVKDTGDPGWDKYYGHGLIDIGAALSKASNAAVPQLNPISNPDQKDEYLVQWSEVSGASEYTLEQSNSQDFTESTVRYRGTARNYRVTGQAGGTWVYRVRANGLSSNTQSTTVRASSLPAPQWKTTMKNVSTSYSLSWSTIDTASQYILEESADPYFSSPRVIYSGSSTSKSISGKSSGQWYYRVRAATQTEKSPWGLILDMMVSYRVSLPALFN